MSSSYVFTYSSLLNTIAYYEDIAIDYLEWYLNFLIGNLLHFIHCHGANIHHLNLIPTLDVDTEDQSL